MYQKTTRNICVTVEPEYISWRSAPNRNYYYFAYKISIRNDGTLPVQLLNRHWVITDAHGKVEEVAGAGVVGAQPRLLAGEKFQYTSYCPLPTEVGTMVGSYEMSYDNGESFDVHIPAFRLAVPYALN